MKKILGLMLGMTFVFGSLAMAQDSANQGTTDTTKSTKKAKKSKKSKGDKMSGDKMGDSSAPKQ
jgi:hypothetical protein